jgi:DNA-binding NtrC family response regulator
MGAAAPILLDEIGSMPFDLQAKFLRVLQERVITRLGSNEPVQLDVRFVATSKVDLEAEVAAGRFRADLFYRLNVAHAACAVACAAPGGYSPALSPARARGGGTLRAQ